VADAIRLEAGSNVEHIADSALAINNAAFAIGAAQSANEYPEGDFQLRINAGTVVVGNPLAEIFIVESINSAYPTSEGGGTPTQPDQNAYRGTFFANATSGEQVARTA